MPGMAEKKHQVFVSSTYRDLDEERRKVMQTLLEMDCIPSGMELFPAADDDVWKLIESVIAEADYYVLIIGGRYGSTDATGVSYTEREYDLAVKLGIPVLPFLHGDPGKIPTELSELDPEARERLEAFRKKVGDKHHFKHWMTADDLAGNVSRALNRAIKMTPRIGWVRGDLAKTTDEIERGAALQNRVRDLERHIEILERQAQDGTEVFAQGEESVSLVVVETKGGDPRREEERRLTFTWNELFRVVANSVLTNPGEYAVYDALARYIDKTHGNLFGGHVRFAREAEEAIRRQFLALELIVIERVETRSDAGSNVTGLMSPFLRSPYKSEWTLTRKGLRQLSQFTAIRRGQAQAHVDQTQGAADA